MAEQESAFKALAELAQLTRQYARGLPGQVDIQPHWSGIGFSLLGRRFVAPMGQVAEMLEPPSVTRLPGVRSWVRGVANVRGRLLPVLDLATFLGGRLTSHRKQQRILVLEVDNLYAGLLVDQVLGMQHFPVDTFVPQSSDEEPVLKPLVDGSYESDAGRWTVFNLVQLIHDAEFINAAVS